MYTYTDFIFQCQLVVRYPSLFYESSIEEGVQHSNEQVLPVPVHRM